MILFFRAHLFLWACRLINAFNAGVYVQVLIEASQVDPCRTYAIEKLSVLSIE